MPSDTLITDVIGIKVEAGGPINFDIYKISAVVRAIAVKCYDANLFAQFKLPVSVGAYVLSLKTIEMFQRFAMLVEPSSVLTQPQAIDWDFDTELRQEPDAPDPGISIPIEEDLD